MKPVRLSELEYATRGRLDPGARRDATFAGVRLDSRTIRPGELFWAVRGEKQDGRVFAADAAAKGAVAVVGEFPHEAFKHGLERNVPWLSVDDSVRALGEFARWYRLQFDPLVVGITGSVGKTTTRELVYSVLATRFHGLRSTKNYNNELGVPLTLLELMPDHEFAVLELGARRVGEIRTLADLIRPEIAAITALAPAHLETFGSLEAIRQAKGELFESVPDTGFVVLPGDDPFAAPLAQRAACRAVFVGEQPHNDLRAASVRSDGGRLEFDCGGARYRVPVAGKHLLTPALIAVAIGREIGLSADEIQEGFERATLAAGRCQVRRLGRWTLVDDTYNASPWSMRAACALLREQPTEGRRIFVAGDMLELGHAAPRFHREFGEQAAREGIDFLAALGAYGDDVVCGAQAAGMPAHRLAACGDLPALLAVLDCWLNEGDVVLVKGSRGMQMERVVDWLNDRASAGAPPGSGRRACA